MDRSLVNKSVEFLAGYGDSEGGDDSYRDYRAISIEYPSSWQSSLNCVQSVMPFYRRKLALGHLSSDDLFDISSAAESLESQSQVRDGVTANFLIYHHSQHRTAPYIRTEIETLRA
jgi:hypothetical protein